jgi:hypothetical protein
VLPGQEPQAATPAPVDLIKTDTAR